MGERNAFQTLLPGHRQVTGATEAAAARAVGTDPVRRQPAECARAVEGHDVGGRVCPEAVRQPFQLTRDAQDRPSWFGAGRERPAHLRGARQYLLDRARTGQQRHLARQAVHPHRVQAQCSAHRAYRLARAEADVDPQSQCAHRWQPAGGWLARADALGAVARQERADGRLVQAGDLQVQIGQILPSFVDEQLRVEVVVDRAELRLHQLEHPGDQAVGSRAAGGERDAVVFAELADVVGDQQQFGKARLADGAHLGGGLLAHLDRRFAAAGLGEAFGQRLLDELGQTLLIGVLNRREAKEHRRAVPTLRGCIGGKWQAELDQLADLAGRREYRGELPEQALHLVG